MISLVGGWHAPSRLVLGGNNFRFCPVLVHTVEKSEPTAKSAKCRGLVISNFRNIGHSGAAGFKLS
jgi:hypothetical protein